MRSKFSLYHFILPINKIIIIKIYSFIKLTITVEEMKFFFCGMNISGCSCKHLYSQVALLLAVPMPIKSSFINQVSYIGNS